MLTQLGLETSLRRANTHRLPLGIDQSQEGWSVTASADSLNKYGELGIAFEMNLMAERLRLMGLAATDCDHLSIEVRECAPVIELFVVYHQEKTASIYRQSLEGYTWVLLPTPEPVKPCMRCGRTTNREDFWHSWNGKQELYACHGCIYVDERVLTPYLHYRLLKQAGMEVLALRVQVERLVELGDNARVDGCGSLQAAIGMATLNEWDEARALIARAQKQIAQAQRYKQYASVARQRAEALENTQQFIAVQER